MRLTMEATVWYSKASLRPKSMKPSFFMRMMRRMALSESPAHVPEIAGHAEIRDAEHILPDGGDALFQFRHRADHGGVSFPGLDHHVGEPVLVQLAARRARHFAEQLEVGRDHVFGQPFGEMVTQGRRGNLGTGMEGHQREASRRVLAGHDHGTVTDSCSRSALSISPASMR